MLSPYVRQRTESPALQGNTRRCVQAGGEIVRASRVDAWRRTQSFAAAGIDK
jgi:hypothetical protein